jgi:hypothetical protein
MKGEYDRVSRRDRLGLTRDLTTSGEVGDGRERGEIVSIRPGGTSRVLLHAVKSYDPGTSRFIPHLRGRCAADFYRP